MTFVDVTLGDTFVIRMELNETGAPTTSKAFVDALPFDGTAVHAQSSGQMFRMLEHVPIEVEDVEDKVQYQAPGTVVYLPIVREIAFAYGNARFSGATGPSTLTHLGDLDGGQLDALAATASKIRHTGAQRIRFTLSEDQTTSLSSRSWSGAKVNVTFDGATNTGTLLEQLSPATTAALKKHLPLQATAVNDTWRGSLTNLETPGPLGLKSERTEQSGTHLVWPGYIYYSPVDDELSLSYGPSSTDRNGRQHELIPVIALDGDWSDIRARARAQLTEGAKPVSLALV